MLFEKMANVNFICYKSKMSGITTFQIKRIERALPVDEQIQDVFVHLISDAVLEMRESGAIIYNYIRGSKNYIRIKIVLLQFNNV